MLSPKQQRAHNTSTGSRGEGAAARFLTTQGYRVVEQNVRYKNHEVDIIAWDNDRDELVFIEVKTRSKHAPAHPSSSITQKKLRSLQICAAAYVKAHAIHKNYRFDCVTLQGDTIEHFENITWLF